MNNEERDEALAQSIGRSLLDKWGWRNRQGAAVAPTTQGDKQGLGYARFQVSPELPTAPSPSPPSPPHSPLLAPSPPPNQSPSPVRSPVDRVHARLDSVIESARHDMVFGIEYKLPSLQVQLHELHQEIHNMLEQRHPPQDRGAPSFVISHPAHRDHLHDLLLLCHHYLEITRSNTTETVFQIKALYHRMWGVRPTRSSSTPKEGTYEAERGSDSEEEEEGEESEVGTWKPAWSLWDVYHHLSSLRTAAGTTYESFSLWWLTLSVATPQLLYTLHSIVFIEGTIPMASSTASDLPQDLQESLSLLASLLSRWKPLLQSQATAYFEEMPGRASMQDWKENKDSAFEVFLHRFLSPVWERVFVGMKEAPLEWMPRYLFVWKQLCVFSQQNPEIFPPSYLVVVNRMLLEPLVSQYHHLLEAQWASHPQAEQSKASLLCGRVGAWIPTFGSGPCQSQMERGIRDLLWELMDDTLFFSPECTEDTILLRTQFLFSHLLAWHEISPDDRSFERNMEILLRQVVSGAESRWMAPEPTPLFHLLQSMVQRGPVSSSLWIGFLKNQVLPRWVNRIRDMVHGRAPWWQVYRVYGEWRACVPEGVLVHPEIYVCFHEALLIIAERLVEPSSHG